MHGYQLSQLASVYNDPYELMEHYYDPPQGNFKSVMRERLGLPYTSKEDQLRPADVYACCQNEPMLMSCSDPCILAVDVGFQDKGKHFLVARKINRKTYGVIYIGIRKTWNEIHDLKNKYNIKIAGVDVAPDIDAAKEFQKSAKFPVWLCDYKAPRSVDTWHRDNETKIIKANRTEMMDATHNLMQSNHILLPRKESVEETGFVRQVCRPFKQILENAKSGIPEYLYKQTNDEDYRHCLNFMYLVGQYAPIVPGGSRFRHDGDCIMDYNPF
jgi:hypothetical protein